MKVEAKLEELGLVLPEPIKVPHGLMLPFAWVRVRGDRAYVSGHVPVNPDGSFAGPSGKVGAEVSEEQGYEAARLTALSILGDLKRALGTSTGLRRGSGSSGWSTPPRASGGSQT
jgi:enamine deaminase RidA (YjgF/YER057c/UK114 family)